MRESSAVGGTKAVVGVRGGGAASGQSCLLGAWPIEPWGSDLLDSLPKVAVAVGPCCGVCGSAACALRLSPSPW